MMFPIGAQTVGIVTYTPVLDGEGNPVRSEVMEPLITDSVIWKGPLADPSTPGCSFEIQVMPRPGEVEQLTGGTTNTNAIAWVLLPVDSDTADLTTYASKITSKNALRYPYPDGDDYQMRSDGHVEIGQNGVPSHVFCMAECQKG